MTKRIFLLFIINYLAVSGVKSEKESFIEKLDMKNVNGRWVCAGHKCTRKSTGCVIEMLTVEPKVVQKYVGCVGGASHDIESIPLKIDRSILIELTSTNGKSRYTIETVGSVRVQGIINPADFPAFKEKFNALY